MSADAPRPEVNLKKGQMLVKVQACSLSPGDTIMLSGACDRIMRPPQFPFVPGMDICGVVEEVAEDSKRFKVSRDFDGERPGRDDGGGGGGMPFATSVGKAWCEGLVVCARDGIGIIPLFPTAIGIAASPWLLFWNGEGCNWTGQFQYSTV